MQDSTSAPLMKRLEGKVALVTGAARESTLFD
jgi:hypothetical protein